MQHFYFVNCGGVIPYHFALWTYECEQKAVGECVTSIICFGCAYTPSTTQSLFLDTFSKAKLPPNKKLILPLWYTDCAFRMHQT
jgi:hypothetical protein